MIENIMTKEFYTKWLQANKPLRLRDALYYVQGIPPNTIAAKFYKKSTSWLYMKAILKAAQFGIISLHNVLGINDPKFFRWAPLTKMSILSPIKFTQHMYQFVSLFPTELFEAYSDVTGEELFLTDYSPLRLFYETQAGLDIWNVEKACYFTSHADPKGFFGLHSPFLPPMHSYKMIINIVKMAKTSINAKELECFEGNPKLVRPLIFLKWIEKKSIVPHPFLKARVIENAAQQETNKLVSENKEIKPRAREIDKVAVQAVAKTLKDSSPNMNIKDLINHNAIQNTAAGRLYEPETLRKWITDAFPEGTFPPGRPPKKDLT